VDQRSAQTQLPVAACVAVIRFSEQRQHVKPSISREVFISQAVAGAYVEHYY
jgi:hypothetical protein